MVSTPESSTPEDSTAAGPSLSGVGADEVLVVPVQVGLDSPDPGSGSGSGAGRLGTVGGRVLPAVRGAGVRLAPVVTSAAGRAGDAARSAGGRVATRAEPVAREAARRGGNALLVIRGVDLTPPPAATPEPIRSRRGGRLAQRVAVVGALAGVSFGVWRALTTKTLDRPIPTDETSDSPVTVDVPRPATPEPGLTDQTALSRPMASPTAATATIPLIGVDPTVGPVPETAAPVPGATGPLEQEVPPAAAG